VTGWLLLVVAGQQLSELADGDAARELLGLLVLH
jgi:hypothetical protein